MPTRTNPRCTTPSAMVKPSGGVPWKKRDACMSGATPLEGVRLMIVVPVPWTFPLLLKFETRISPGFNGPPAGNPGGTNAMP